MAGSVNLETICKHMLLLFSRCSKSLRTLHYPTTKIQTIFCRCNIFGYFCAVFMTKGIQRPALRQTEHVLRTVPSNPFFARTHKRIKRILGIIP